MSSNAHEKLNYVELPAKDLVSTKVFFQRAFDWQFTDYGPEYIAFDCQGLEGGFFKSPLCASADKGSALLIFFSTDLDATASKITQAGGVINKPVFSFPGGRRFHFIEPSGNEFAVWSDK